MNFDSFLLGYVFQILFKVMYFQDTYSLFVKSTVRKGRWYGQSITYKIKPAGSLSSSQPGGPPCWASPLAFGLIGVNHKLLKCDQQKLKGNCFMNNQKTKSLVILSLLGPFIQYLNGEKNGISIKCAGT